MTGVRPFLARLAAALIALQAAWAGTSAAAMAAQGPGAQGWCGTASPAIERALTAIFAQDGAETPGADAPHCPVCALAKAATLAAPLAVPVPQDRPAALTFTAPAAKTAPPPATGPPLGGRAPPFA